MVTLLLNFKRRASILMVCLLATGLASAQTSPIITPGTVGDQLILSEIDCAEGSAARWFDFTQDGDSPDSDIYFGDATATNGDNELGLTWEYSPIGGGDIRNVSSPGIRTNTAQGQTATMSISLSDPLVNPLVYISGLERGSTIEFFDCNGVALNPVLVASQGDYALTGNTLIQTSNANAINANLQFPGTVSCFYYVVTSGATIGSAGEGVTFGLRTCVEEIVTPPCVTCGPDETFRYLSLSGKDGMGTGATADVNLDGVKVGDATVLYSDLSIREDLNGRAFGAFARDNETMVLQIDLCAPIAVQRLDVLGLETESQVWVGTSIAGAGATAVPGGLTLTQCDGPTAMAPTGGMVTNTASSCLNQGNGKYTIGGAMVSTLYFRYTNPTGGCSFDKATFRIGTCVAPIVDTTPECTLNLYNVTEGGDTRQLYQDANGLWFQSSVCSATMAAATPVKISPCATTAFVSICNQCFIPPVFGDITCSADQPIITKPFTISATGLENMKGADNNETDFGLNAYLYPAGTTAADFAYPPATTLTIAEATALGTQPTVPVFLGPLVLADNCTTGSLTVVLPAEFPQGDYNKVFTLDKAPTLDPTSKPAFMLPEVEVIPTMGQWALFILALMMSTLAVARMRQTKNHEVRELA